ncbi:MAG: hypothetical protein HZA17_12200 [Nitrospirae bacterium]|nr:hypothetical protein [Nitrospirota bacterium]
MGLDLQLAYLLSLIGAFGFLGGFISAIYDLQSSPPIAVEHGAIIDCSDCKWKFSYLFEKKRIVWTFLGRGLIGIAGAFSIMLVGLWVGKITVDMTQGNQIFIISLALVSGTISYRMLPKIGHKLEEQILKQKMEETERSAKTESKKAVDFSSAMSAAETALSRNNFFEMPQAIAMLEALRPAFPSHRTLHIYLGRLYRMGKKFDKAILVLRDFINALEIEKSKGVASASYDADTAAAHYNIACYHVLKAFQPEVSEQGKNRLIVEGMNDLKESLKRYPTGIEKAKDDDDFKFVKDNPIFQALTKKSHEDVISP